MKKNPFILVILALVLVTVAGCSGGSDSTPPPPPPAGSAQLSLMMTDTPPAGVTILAFEISITGATLTPQGGGTPVTLVDASNPVRVEVKRLETENAFLSTRNVAEGTYQSLGLTFANPELVVRNDSGQSFGSCATGQICKLEGAALPLNPASVTISSAPFPLTITANTPFGLLVDFNLNNVIQNNLTLNLGAPNAVAVTTRPAQQGRLDDVDDVTGVVANKAASQFTLQTRRRDFTVTVDANTRFEDFSEGTPPCTANPQDFTCVQNGQIVEVDFHIMAAAGTFLAKKIELEDNQADDELEGVVAQVNSSTQFTLVLLEELRDVSGIDSGDILTVNLAPIVSFRVDNNGLNVPSTQRNLFEGSTDTSQMIAGQVVQVRRRDDSSGSTIVTDRVRLRMSRFSAIVTGAPTGSNFNVNGLPGIFTSANPPITQIQVQTSDQTDFDGVANVAGLADGNSVSLRGLLFKGTPVILVAKKVRKR